MKNPSKRPPKFPSWLAKCISRKEENYSLLGDLEEDYLFFLKKKGRRKASLWYWYQIFSSLPRLLKNSFLWSFIMFRNYLLIAVRNIKKHKGISFINIIGLSVGLAICIVIFLFVRDEWSYDLFHKNSNRLYRVIRVDNRDSDQQRIALTQAPLASSLKENYREIEEATTFNYGGGTVSHGDKYFANLRIGFTTPSFFRMFSYEFLNGNPERVLDEPHSVVLTNETALRLFGGKNPIGDSIEFSEQVDLKVTGIIREPQKSHIDFDLIVPLSLHKEFGVDLSSFNRFNYTTYVLLHEQLSSKEVDKKLFTYLDSIYGPDSRMALELQPLSKIYLHSSSYDYDVHARTSDIRVLIIFSLIAVFTLLIACINFMNLATARSERRMREVGIRKVIGATRIQLIRQFISESILMAFVAMFMAVFLVELLLPFFNSIFMKHMSFIKSFNIFGMLVLLAFVLFAGFIAGSYPAFFLSAFIPINSLHGKHKKGNEKSLIRKLLVVGQFTVSIVLIIMTTVLYKQLHFMQHKKLGYNKERMVCIPMSQEVRSRYEALKNSFLDSSNVVSLTAADNLPTWQGPSYYLEEWEGRNSEKVIKMHECAVDYDYFKTFEMEIIHGRTFSRDLITDMNSSLLVNEEAARQMNMTDPVGKYLGSNENKRLIIGIVKDFHHDSLRNRIQPMTFKLDPENTNYIIFRLSTGTLAEKLVSLEDKWKKIIQNQPFNYYFLDQFLNRNYQPEIIIGKAITFFSMLAIFIASLGLFGLAAFTAEQRTKEIGIRKILGASSIEIFTLLARDFTLRVAAAGIIAVPISYLGAVTYLKNYAFRTSLGVLVFVLPILASLFLALFTVSYQSIRASRINPSTSLRYE